MKDPNDTLAKVNKILDKYKLGPDLYYALQSDFYALITNDNLELESNHQKLVQAFLPIDPAFIPSKTLEKFC